MESIKFEDLSEKDQKIISEFKTWLWSKIKPDMSNLSFSVDFGKHCSFHLHIYEEFRSFKVIHTSDLLRSYLTTRCVDSYANIFDFVRSKNYFMPQITNCHITEKSISIS